MHIIYIISALENQSSVPQAVDVLGIESCDHVSLGNTY